MFWSGFSLYITLSICILVAADFPPTPTTPWITSTTTVIPPTTTPSPSPKKEDLPLYCSNGIGYYVEGIVKADYYRAFFFCKYHGLELLSVTSRDTERSLIDVLSRLDIPDDTYFLTSARSLDTSSSSNPEEWVWMASGKYMKYTNWQTTSQRYLKQFKSDDSNSCANILYNRKQSSKIGWVKTSCSDSYHFICQTGPSTDQCHDQWKSKASSKAFYPEVYVVD